MAAPARLPGAPARRATRGTAYHYELRQGATLADYNMEAQGDLLADYFMLKHRRKPEAMRQQCYRDSHALCEAVLAVFLADPGGRANLHRGLARRLVRAPVWIDARQYCLAATS